MVRKTGEIPPWRERVSLCLMVGAWEAVYKDIAASLTLGELPPAEQAEAKAFQVQAIRETLNALLRMADREGAGAVSYEEALVFLKRRLAA